MREITRFYVDGQWVEPTELNLVDVINPATEKAAGHVALGTAADVDAAVSAARRAFATWGRSSVDDRVVVLGDDGVEYRNP
ncbi:aldehyde dehydrogenase family protein, partial [Gordonia aichiensis]